MAKISAYPATTPVSGDLFVLARAGKNYSADFDDVGGSVSAGNLFGLTLSNNAGDATNDIDITTGTCRDSTDTVTMIFASALTKRLDAGWVAGTNQGMRNSAAAITNTTYHIYAVSKAAGADPDYYAHTSTTVATVIAALQAEAGGALYIYARRVGSIIRAVSTSAIVPFVQDGDKFTRKVPIRSSAVSNQTTLAASITLDVPTGIRVDAIIVASMYDATSTAQVDWLVTDLSQTDSAPTTSLLSMYTIPITAGNPAFAFLSQNIMTNTSAQIRSRIETQLADLFLNIFVHGWIDKRGRLA